MVEFDVEGDQAFLLSLDDLGKDVADATLYDLFNIAANLSWQSFCADYKWRPHERIPIDTYPGAVDYFKFDVPMPHSIRAIRGRTHVTVFALNYSGPEAAGLILCAVAQ